MRELVGRIRLGRMDDEARLLFDGFFLCAFLENYLRVITLMATVEKLIDTSITERTKEKGLKALPEETKRAYLLVLSMDTVFCQ